MKFKRRQFIEENFFALDKENKIAHIDLEFGSPKDIFDSNVVGKTPMLNDDFMEWLTTALEYTPRRYKLDLSIHFAEMDGYEEEALTDAFKKNMMLEFIRIERKVHSKNKIAYLLIGLGLAFLLSMILIENLWQGESLARTIFTYVFDIATTVTFWEALTILVVETFERRKEMRFFAKTLNEVTFAKKEAKQ